MLKRVHLLANVGDRHRARATWLVGPPGSGKTTLLAGFADEHPSHVLWHQVTADDSDPSGFFARMANACSDSRGTSARHLPTLASDAAFSVVTYARQFYRSLYATFPNLLLVIDDYQEVGCRCLLHDWIRIAVEEATPEVHLVIASQTQPPSALVGCHVSGALRLVTAADLAFTVNDVAGIAKLAGLTLDSATAEQCRLRCGESAAEIRLLLRTQRLQDQRLAAREPTQVDFSQLRLAAIDALDEETQHTLLRLALLPDLPCALVGDLFGSPVPEICLAELAADDLFVSLLQGTSPAFRLQCLFKDDLLDRAIRTFTPDQVLAWQLQAAQCMEAHGRLEEAARLLAQAQNWDRLTALILRHAAEMMSRCRRVTLAHWLAVLPPGRVQQQAWLMYWQAACRPFDDPATGQVDFTAAFHQFETEQDRMGQLLAWSGAADCIFRLYANLAQLDAWIDRLQHLLAHDTSFPAAEVDSRVTLSLFVALSFRQPAHAELPSWRARLEAMAPVVPDPVFRLLSRLHLALDSVWQGDLCKARVELEWLAREALLRPSTPFSDLVVAVGTSTYSLFAGQVTDCFEAIDRGLTIALESGIPFWDKIFLGQGAMLALSNGDLARGRDYLRRRAVVTKGHDDEEQGLHHLLEAWALWLAARLSAPIQI